MKFPLTLTEHEDDFCVDDATPEQIVLWEDKSDPRTRPTRQQARELVRMANLGAEVEHQIHPRENYELSAVNSLKDPIEVRHADLKRSDTSKFRSDCPACKLGILPVTRDPDTLEVISRDRCLLCGQRFIYQDLPRK